MGATEIKLMLSWISARYPNVKVMRIKVSDYDYAYLWKMAFWERGLIPPASDKWRLEVMGVPVVLR